LKKINNKSDSEIVNEQIEKLLSTNVFGEDFSFRAGQRDTVFQICVEYLKDKNQTIILDAPTGTGKSIIAMASSWVLTKLKNIGYIVTSDLMLQEQYEKDFKKFKFPWGSIKGVDNYKCEVNGYKFSLGECRIRGMGYDRAKTLPCASRCGYLVNRAKTVASSVSLLNYSYWLIQRNYVEKKAIEQSKNIPFEKRDFAFFDEAHKIDSIVQNHFSPRIKKDLVSKMTWIQDFLDRNDFKIPTISITMLTAIVDNIFEDNRKSSLYENLKFIEREVLKVIALSNKVKEQAEKLFDINSTEGVPKEWKSAFKILDFLKDTHCKLEDYNLIIEDIGINGLIKNHSNPEEVQFQCLDERYMIINYFHKKAGFKVLMSATIGDPSRYASSIGLSKAKVIRLDNGFNYEKSPIIYIGKYKLNYKEREENLPKVLKILDKIIEVKHPTEKGIIHTGSYYFMKYILENSKHKDRFLAYDDSDKKRIAINKFINYQNKILIGPSILEGLDLKNDSSRFQIFMKVPYPSLSDPLIKAKLNTSQHWYNWKTSIGIMQGVGRSVRNKEDWAVTYLLDGCFGQLLHKPGLFPNDFKKRLKEYN
jgi:ATP-dependent DNA helicase DinG